MTAIPFDRQEGNIVYNITDEENMVFAQLISTPSNILADAGVEGSNSISDRLGMKVDTALSRMQARKLNVVQWYFHKDCKLLMMDEGKIIESDPQKESYSNV